MRKIIFLLLITCFTISASIAQNVPAGMKYQAVARNNAGEVLQNRTITLRIDLKGDPAKGNIIYYSEEHTVTTSQLGLFDLVIGDGRAMSGTFDKIPWSSVDIWMGVSLKDKGTGFSAITESRLLAVPYAFYAATAGEMVGNPLNKITPPQPVSPDAAQFEGKSCPCEGGLSQITVLYLGASNVTVKVYRNKNLTELLNSFSGVNNGAILTISSANFPDGKLKSSTFFKVIGTDSVVTEMPTECEELKEPWEMSLGETFGNFSMLSHLDAKNQAKCSVCDIRMQWKVGGNALMDLCNIVGTKSYTDIVFITNNIERFRITKDGDININNNLQIGNNLTINNNVDIGNNLTVRNNVFLNTLGGATINNGPFSVNNLSATKLTGLLTVDKDSWLKTKLRVDGVTDLNSSFNVNNTSASVLTGTLRVDKDATFKQKVLIDNATLLSSSTTTGGLVVTGGAGIGQNLYLGNNMDIGNNALIRGRAGIGNVYSNVRLNVSALSTDAIPFNVEVTGTGNKFSMNSDGQLYLRSVKAGSATNSGNYAMMLDAQNQGLLIKLNEKDFPDGENHYISFWGSKNVVRGRIEGQTASELHNSFDYIWFQAMSAIDNALSVAMVVVDLIGVDDGDAAIVDGVELLASVAEWAKQSVEMEDNVGVTYESGSGDYAEWLKKENNAEQFSFGDVVAVKGGVISKNTTEADHYLVVSMSPIVLGNMPAKGQEASYEKIAFMGQVPVKVKGSVNIGDYIIPSGMNDGIGIAMPKSKMNIDQYKSILGVAWSKGNSAASGYSLVNVAIGITQNSLVDKITEQDKELNTMKNYLNTITAYLSQKDPSFKAIELPGTKPAVANKTTTNDQVVKNTEPVTKDFSIAKVKALLHQNIQVVTDVLANTRLKMEERKIDYEKFPKIKQLLTDPNFFIESIGKDPSSFR